MNTERIVAGLVERIERRYFGKYRGFVVDNDDPRHLGRLRVRVPSVFGPSVVSGWAMPCVPYGGAAGQGLLFVPDDEAGVWVEFEEGDLEFPIWVGTFWSAPDGNSELPVPLGASEPQSPPTTRIIATAKGHTLQFDDADDGGIRLHDGVNGHSVVLDGEGVRVEDGVNAHTVVLDGDGVRVEDGAHDGNRIVLDAAGVTVQDSHGNTIATSASGIALGANAAEEMVLGTQFKLSYDALVGLLLSHVHPPGSPSPTLVPLQAVPPTVPLSTKQTVA